jgi:aminomethyltransferase
MSLYGSDLSEEYTPLDSGLAWTVNLDDPSRDFNGRDALLNQKEKGSAQRMTGLVLEGRGVLRAHQPVYQDDELLGEITSGTFSPTLEKSIALARLSRAPTDKLEVEIRGKRVVTREVKYPFVRNGRVCIDS